MLRHRWGAVVVAAVAVTSTACAQDTGTGGPSQAGPTLAVVADDPTPAPTASPTESAPPAPRFGATFEYAAGLRVRVAKPQRFEPSPWVERQPGTPMFFSVVVRNRTGDVWNPSQLHVRLISGFQPAPQIYDAEKGIVARPDRRVPAGKGVRFSVAYWVTDPTQLSLELAPGFGYQTTTIKG